MNEAEAILFFLKIWMIIGAVIAVVFLTIGIDRIDEDAQGAYVFRPLLVPALLVIWPLVLWRWFVLETGSDRWQNRHNPPRNAHFWVSIIFAISIPAIIIVGLAQRQVWPADFTPQKISQEQKTSQEQGLS